MEHTKYAYSRSVLIDYTEYGYNRLSFDRVRLESVQPFARFTTFDRVCLASVQPFTFDRVRILKSTISPQRVNKVIARRQEVE